MGRIPVYEDNVAFRPAMQPFSSGDGYEAPGKGLQKVGQGIAAVGQGIASLQGMMDENELHKAKLAALQLADEQNTDDMESQRLFNPDTDDPLAYAGSRVQRFDERYQNTISQFSNPRARRLLELHGARIRSGVGSRSQAFGIDQYQSKTAADTEKAITSQFLKLQGFRAMEPSADAENQEGYAGAGAPASTAGMPDAGEQYTAEVEKTLSAAESMIHSMPGPVALKERLIKAVKPLVMAAYGRRQDAWPAVETWLRKQEATLRAAGPAGPSSVSSARSGSPVEFLRTKLAPGYEQRTSDVDNLNPAKQDRLAAFLAAADDAGHDIRIVSGHRSNERQAKLWADAVQKYGSAAAARSFVAPPGGSTHQSGEAVDLQYQDRGAGLGGRKTAAVEWAHKNAAKFGLHFPLGHEDWHIEPVEARSGGKRYGGQYDPSKTYWKPAEMPSYPDAPAGKSAEMPNPPAMGAIAGTPADMSRSPVMRAVTEAAGLSGVSPEFLAQIAQIESSGNPNKRTGSYAGLFQLSAADFRKYGGKGSITDPEQNAAAAANKFKDLSSRFVSRFNREPTPGELYLMHQQGEGGANAHFSNPDRPAWQSMASTGEGRDKGEAWAKRAIWGNLTPEAKRQFGSVENVTSRQFVEFWSSRVEGGSTPQDGGPTRVAQAAYRATDAAPVPQMSRLRSEIVDDMLKAAPQMKAAHILHVGKQIEDVESLAAKGQVAPDAMIARLTAMAERSGDEGLRQRMALLPQVLAVSRAENQASPAQLTAVIQQMEAAAQRGPITPQQSAQIDHLKAKRAETEKALKANPYEHGNRVGLLPAPVPEIVPTMGQEDMQKALEARMAARVALEGGMSQPLPLFQGREQQEMVDYLNKQGVPPEVKLGVLRTMYDVIGPGVLKDFNEAFGKDAAHLAQIGWLMVRNADPMAMKDAIRGYDLRKTDGFVSRVPESKDEIRSATDRIVGVGNSAFAAMPGADGYAIEVAKLIYEARAHDKGLDPKLKTLDPTLWQESLNEAMGQNKVGEITYGGIGRVSTGMFSSAPVFVIPSVKADGGLQDIMSKIRMSDLVPLSPAKGAAAAAGREDDAQSVALPGDARGKPVPIGVIRSATPVWAGGTRYFLRTGTDARGQPEFIKIAGAPDTNYAIDVEALREPMQPRVAKDTYRKLDGQVSTIADMLARFRNAPKAPAPNMDDGSTFTPRFAPGARKRQPAG